MLVLIGTYLLVVFVLPLALSAVVSYRALPMGRRCPMCRGDAIVLRHRGLRLLSRIHRRVLIQRRWCLGCGWEGVVRVPRDRRRAVPPRAPIAPPDPPPATQTLDLRSLTVDGRPWRVMLQCWNQTGLFYGRLVFIAPSGRLWLDAIEAFAGSTHREVLGQASTLTDGLLTNRLRRLVGDY